MPRTRSRHSRGRTPYSRNRICQAIIHDEGCQAPLMRLNGKKIPKIVLQRMRDHDPPILPGSQNRGYICQKCVDHFMDSDQPSHEDDDHVDSESSNSEGMIEDDDSVVGASFHVSQSEMPASSKPISGQLCDRPSDERTGPILSSDESGLSMDMIDQHMKSDIKILQSIRTNINSLATYKASEWLSERPKDVVMHVCRLLGYCSASLADEGNAVRVARTLEVMYAARCSRLVLPQTLRDNMVFYNLSGSKLLINYFGSFSAGGSYSYLMSLLNSQASTPLGVPKGALRVVIDNEQVVGKRYSVSIANQVPISIVTSKIYIQCHENVGGQGDVDQKPSNWLFGTPNAEQRKRILEVTTVEQAEIFRSSRDDIISSMIIAVEEEFKAGCDGKDFIDVLVGQIEESITEKICENCGADNARTSRLCTNCKGLLVHKDVQYSEITPETTIDPYDHFQYSIDTKENKCKVYVGEPEMANPNSYENISTVLRNIGKEAGIHRYGGTLRHWMYLECDGGIYPIIAQLIFSVFYCDLCGVSFYGEDKFKEHRCSILHDQIPQHEFDWLVILPGLLHLEMNGARAFLDFTWDVFMKDIAQVLGFKSDRALQFARKGSDHHKTWQMLEIIYIALTKELLVPFVLYCHQQSCTATNVLYWDWCTKYEDPNYDFIQQTVFTYLHSLMLLRNGVRKGNDEAIQAAKWKLSSIFFGRNHPTYRKIMAMDKFMMEMMPNEMKDRIGESTSLSRTSTKGRYQGGDACLEEVNKDAKSWTPPGVPTNVQWQRIFRNLELLNKIRSETMSHAKVGPSSSQGADGRKPVSHIVPYQEVAAVRCLMRRRQYLLHSNTLPKDHRSLSGDLVLTDDLRYFSAISVQSMKKYMSGFLNGELENVTIVSISKREQIQKESVETLTKEQIRKKIYEAFEQIESSSLLEDHFKKYVSKRNKSEFVAFYYEVLEKVPATCIMEDMDETAGQNDD